MNNQKFLKLLTKQLPVYREGLKNFPFTYTPKCPKNCIQMCNNHTVEKNFFIFFCYTKTADRNCSVRGLFLFFCFTLSSFLLVYRMSMYSPLSALFMLRTAQNLPHIEQVSSCSGERSARIAFAVCGSSAHSHYASQSKARRGSPILSSISLAPRTPLAISAA